jgi:hypothetical protein
VNIKITAVIVTRGGRQLDVDLLNSLVTFDEVIIWDNTRSAKDVRVYGRFMGAVLARNSVVYVQDDDCVVDAESIALSAQPGRVVCNMPVDRRPEYAGTGVALIGWGTVFDKTLVASSFDAYLRQWPQDELFERECDRLFTYVNRRRMLLVDAGLRHLPHAHGADRMGREARHRADYEEMRSRARGLDEPFARHAALGIQVV